jgi:hypothetical protein
MFDHDPPCSVCGNEHYPWCKTTKPAKGTKYKQKKFMAPDYADLELRAANRLLGQNVHINGISRPMTADDIGIFLDRTVGHKHGIFDRDPLEVFDDFE